MRSAWNVRVAGWMCCAPRPSVRSMMAAELTGAADRAGSNDRARDGLRPLLLAIGAQDRGELGNGQRVDEVGRAFVATRIHPHVEGAVMAERKTAFGFIELERRDAEIERDAIGPANAVSCQQFVHLGEAAAHQREPAGEAFGQRASAGDRIFVAIDRVNRAARTHEEGRRVAAAPESRIDIDRIVARRENRHDFFEHHRDMRTHAAPPARAARARAMRSA